MAYLIAFVLLAGTVGRVGVKKVLTVTTRADEPGPTVAAAVVIILAGAVTTAALGMEPIFGAFIAGTVISASRIAQRQLAALRTLVLSVLAPLFLATAGLRVDVTVLARPVVALTALVIVLVAIFGKFAGAYAGARLRRLSSREGIALGAGMNARGVVEVVIALAGLRLGVLNTTTYTIVVLVALVTSDHGTARATARHVPDNANGRRASQEDRPRYLGRGRARTARRLDIPGENPPPKGGPRRSEGPPPLHYGGRPMRRPGP